MIGPLEILIVVVILLVIFGGYKKLPALGRSAGKRARIGSEKAKELVDTTSGKVGEKVGDKVGDRIDPASIGRSAGRGMREVREVREAFTGALKAPAETEAKEPAGAPSAPVETEPTQESEQPNEPDPLAGG